jgi:hypothetical protein
VTAQNSRPDYCLGKYWERQSLSQCTKYIYYVNKHSINIVSTAMLFILQKESKQFLIWLSQQKGTVNASIPETQKQVTKEKNYGIFRRHHKQ